MARSKASNRPLTSSTAHLPANLDKRLIGYAAAAVGAGVGVLALSQPAEAKIIYTPSNIPIPANGGAVSVDLNHDGVVDFTFSNIVISGAHPGSRPGVRPPEGTFGVFLFVNPAQGGNGIGASNSFAGIECAAELRPGRNVGPGKNFQSRYLPMSSIFGTYGNPGTQHCEWNGNKGGFLGLKFTVGGNTFYGWAHVTLGTVPAITGYAYENVPNTAIVTGATRGPEERSDASRPLVLPAPQPATLGHLAQGARALPFWRRPEEMN
mgnify:CR=1 FL=1